jgi:cyclic pyranopterin phosphate synthase
MTNEAATDTLGRPLRDLRVSVTDRCNMRCRYCMPREVFGPGFVFAPRQELLTFEEISDVVAAFARAGVRKVRLTGGEPTLRAGLPDLVAMIAEVPDVEDIALTTNGSLLSRHAARLRAAGLRRVTVSLDTLDPQLFKHLSDTEISLETVLAGIETATDVGFGPIKLNTVVRRGVNDGDVERVAEFARERGHIVRFIEYMDVGDTNGWRLDEVVPSAEIVARISARWPLEPTDPNYRGEVAARYRYLDGMGEIGVISSISEPFCGDCSRARLSSEGSLYTCLFAAQGTDLRRLLRDGSNDEALRERLRHTWLRRNDRYSEERRERRLRAVRKIEMHYIGG